MKQWNFLWLLALLMPMSCGKAQGEGGQEEEPDPFVHYNYYQPGKVTDQLSTYNRYKPNGELLQTSEMHGIATYNEEGLVTSMKTFQDGKLTISSDYTYGDHSMRQIQSSSGATYEYRFTYEDAGRTRAIEEYWGYLDNETYDTYQKVIRSWDNNRTVLEETYLYSPSEGVADLLVKRVRNTYADNGLTTTVHTYTFSKGLYGASDKEVEEEKTTTYRDSGRRQPETVVSSSSQSTHIITNRYTYNEDQLLVRRDYYVDEELTTVYGYIYKDNTMTEYLYEALLEGVSVYTFLGEHSYQRSQEKIPSPFSLPLVSDL